jgi:DeoR/GlpR family transcriptional regulator of sugar metabolism
MQIKHFLRGVMVQDEWHLRKLEVVSLEGKLTIGEICQMFDVSDMTARCNLRLFDCQGMLKRIHGGALSSLRTPPYNLRSTVSVFTKQTIRKESWQDGFCWG